MKINLSLFFLITTVLLNAQVPTFATKKSLGSDMVARYGAGMVAHNNKLYIIGGYANCGPKDFTEYDPNTGVLKKLKNLGGGCSNPIYVKGMFVIQNKLYLLYPNAIQEYNFQTNSWGDSTFLSLASGTLDAAFVVNNIIYISTTNNDLISYNPLNGQAAQKADYPGPANRRGVFAFAIGNKGYLGAGTTSGSNGCSASDAGCFRSEFYEYDTLTDIWTVKASLPTAFFEGVGTSVNGKGYAGTGRSSLSSFVDYRSSFWYEYDPVTNVWTSKQNFMNSTNPPAANNPGKQASSITTIGNDIFLFGGITSNVSIYDDSVHKYNTITNTWTLVDGDVGKNRTEASGFYLNGKVYVGGGEDNEGLSDFWEYDSTSNNWIQKANLPTIHTQRAATEVAGKGYMVGGYSRLIQNTGTNPEFLDALIEYNPLTNIWTNKAPYPSGKRRGMIAMSYNGRLYAGSGLMASTQQVTNNFHEYNPATDTWSQKMSMPFSGGFLSSFVIGNIGYVITFAPQKLVGKYNFDTNTWTTESHALTAATNGDQSSFVYNGIGYIVLSGYNGANSSLFQYNPANSTWSQVTNLSFANSSQNLIAANDGVYFGFGRGGGTDPLGLYSVNDWRFLKFDGAVSSKFGVYKTEVSIGSGTEPLRCGTGTLDANATHSVFDTVGDLFSTFTAGASSNTGACYEVTSVNLSTPFLTSTSNFGNNIVETAMFLNKSVTFQRNNGLFSNGNFRLYYTTVELNKLVSDFNTLYGANKTIADIKLIRYIDNVSVYDSNPLNNTFGTYQIFSTTSGNFGIDRFYDINLASTLNASGEIYAVLLAGQNLSNDVFSNKKISIYPNPATNILNITLKDNTTIDSLSITDLSGKKILEQNGNKTAINIENLAAGMYVLKVVSGVEEMVSKFTKN